MPKFRVIQPAGTQDLMWVIFSACNKKIKQVFD